ncbi:hypothetical protein JCM16161A_20950 [Vulcanisaeta sp. JCM 16161]|uniref:hypothetical protein n=1 Tax=Vulcanisaeta sp. JCM 16161 TaxID=1295372 RepID=UPI00406C025F
MDGIYRVYLPWYVKLNDGSRYRIPLNVIMRGLRNNVFVIRVPQDEVDYVAEELIRRGFKPTILAVNKGERYSLAMKVESPWEIHTRVFPDGIVESEVEISRDYLQHLVGPRFNVVYEIYDLLKDITDYRRICIKPLGRCINDVIENIGIELRAPRALMPWKPLIAVVSLMALTPVIGKVSKSSVFHLLQ